MTDLLSDRRVGYPLGGGGPNPGQHWIYLQLGAHSESKARGKEGVMSYSEEGVVV